MKTDLSDLSEQEIDTYFRVLVRYASHDGVHATEKAYVTAQAQVLGYDTAPLWAADFAQPSFDSLTSTLKKIILRDALVLAHIDGEYSEKEALGLRTLCQAMKLDERVLEDIESWLDDLSHVLARGRDLFG